VAKAREAALAVRGRLYVPHFDDIGPYDYYPCRAIPVEPRPEATLDIDGNPREVSHG
jgi:hypothetical protein